MAPTLLPRGLNMGQHRPNTGQHGPNIGPTWAQDGPKIAQHRWPNMGTTCVQNRPRLLPYRQALRIVPASVQNSPPWVCAENRPLTAEKGVQHQEKGEGLSGGGGGPLFGGSRPLTTESRSEKRSNPVSQNKGGTQAQSLALCRLSMKAGYQ